MKKAIHASGTLVSFILIMLFTTAGGVFAQCATVYVPLQEALNATISDNQVTVSTKTVTGWSAPDYYYEFLPASGPPTEALIIYPGACLDASAYAVLAHDIAAAGYLVALVPMPSYVAILGINRADAVISSHPEIERWSIGGHSFGGVGACWYISGNYTYSNIIKGVVLWASYPDSSQPINTKPVKVISVWGTNDGLTDAADINASKANLPSDTRYVALQGANHTQFGWYGNSATDYGFLQPNDNPAAITRQQQTDFIVQYTLSFLDSLTPKIPAALETITATDGSTWERVCVPGLGNNNNFSVVAMAEYQGRLYAMTRNEAQGAEVWRTTSAGGWEQVLFPGGVTNGIYGNTRINNVWARMIVFNDKLYFGFSSGLQGAYLGSSGAEIWRYDGSNWEPVISDKRDIDEAGTIAGIDSCAASDGSTTATITDNSKNWTVNQWTGGVLQITSGSGTNRKFRIISNDANTLTIQQNETAGTFAADGVNETEYTVCASQTYNNPFPAYSYTLGAVVVGNSYEIGMAYDENGFGDFWNKTITSMRIFSNRLYVSTGLNYEYGGQIWYTENGDDWMPTFSALNVPAPFTYNSFGNFHTPNPPNCNGYSGCRKPVSSSVTDLTVSSVSGAPVLYAGGTGTSGKLGGCSRMARLTDNGWELMVDVNVDTNSTGSNENGFGSPGSCGTNQYNFMPWSLADFNDKLMIGVLGDGARVLYSPSGSSVDGSWYYSVGQANIDPLDPSYVDPLGTSSYPNGFDGYQYSSGAAGTLYQNLAVNLFAYATTLYGGIICQYVPEYSTPPTIDELHGSQIWKTSDAGTWTQITHNGFGDKDIINFEAFTVFDGNLYVSGSKGASSTPQGLGGAKIFRLQAPVATTTTTTASITTTTTVPPTVITLSSFEATGVWRRIVLTWATESEANNAGFNVYRATQEDGSYTKINASIIPAKGSSTQGTSYEFIDTDVKRRKTYYYKLEDVDLNGTSTMHGPISGTPGFFANFK